MEETKQLPIEDSFMPSAPALNGVNGTAPEPFKGSSQSPGPKWSDGFARRVVAYAISGDRLPDGFSPDLFNPQSKSPRSIIAKVVCDYFEKWSRVPSVDTIEELLTAEDDAVKDEWQAVQATDLED